MLVLTLGTSACATNREVLSAPAPETLNTYLISTHPLDIRVTARSGQIWWFHNPVIDGDTLHGVRDHDLSQARLALPVADVARVEEPHFSAGKTVGYFGGFFAAVALVIALAVGSSKPVY